MRQLRFEFHGNDVDDDYVIAGQEPVKALRSIVKRIKKEVRDAPRCAAVVSLQWIEFVYAGL
jgi:hypothetical protein